MLEKITGNDTAFSVFRGPLLRDLLADSSHSLDSYIKRGGYALARRIIQESAASDVIDQIATAGLRGRAGGGFPTAQKWFQVSRSVAKEKYFICNAHSGQPGGFKERFLIQANPHRLIEATLIAAFAVGAETAFIFLPEHFSSEAHLLDTARREALNGGLIGRNVMGSHFSCNLVIYRGLGGYISGEETAIMRLIEGKVGLPRRKPPMPAYQGLFNAPTAINNSETVLQAYHLLKCGVEEYRKVGTPGSSGSMVFCVSGDVRRPGIYELPLGTKLSELIFDYAHGPKDGSSIKLVFPGGVSSLPVGPDQFDLALDYDTLHDAGSSLGSGAVIVIGKETGIRHLTRELAAFFHRESCGKCKPCKEGTMRILDIATQLDEQKNYGGGMNGTSANPFKILDQSGAVNLPDMRQLENVCDLFRHLGDCRHITEAASSIERLVKLFPEELRFQSALSNGLEQSNGHN